MSNTRKLQGEIDKLLKKIQEGCIEFDAILTKVYAAGSANQKEKYEADLKKEIKKLQRAREQLKNWVASNEVKQKAPLLEARRNIETKMEQFKACERDSKMKAFSKEGLAQADRDDSGKSECRTWIGKALAELNTQIDSFESEMEAVPVKKRAGNARVDHLTEATIRHKFHLTKLEKVLRNLENENIPPEEVMEIKDSVEYYVENNQEADFFEDETVYDNLGLKDDIDLRSSLDSLGSDSDDDDNDSASVTSESSDTSSSSAGKKTEPLNINKNPLQGVMSNPAPLKSSTVTTPVTILNKPKATLTPSPVSSSPGDGVSPPTAAQIAARKLTTPPPTAAPNVPKQIMKSPLSLQAQAKEAVVSQKVAQSPKKASAPPSKASLTPAPTPVTSATSATSTTPPPSEPQNAYARALQKEGTASMEYNQFVRNAPGSTSPATSTAPPATPNPAPSLTGPSTPLSPPTAPVFPISAGGPPPLSYAQQAGFSEKNLPISQSMGEEDKKDTFDFTGTLDSLPDFNHLERMEKPQPPQFNSFRSSGEDSLPPLAMLEASMKHIPEPSDSERSRPYSAPNPTATPHYYPQVPSPLFDIPTTFDKFETDTLFFIFYYQQGTYQQYLAAKELKKQSWRYHKKYLTWFQRHEEPKEITNDHEQGTYVYFDYEAGWCQRKKAEFTFEYIYLEDYD
eukprot:TRINITY_DN5470_c0_g1_i1.p1 TRINITY_DN5470_c0_g1~~TRINITY_DN5470_c0_g1_i1.p1  ORF type:complete len:682 (-),score=199.79 TRINITY_DN5470_c0_g1_i1:45-2090(-)